MTAINPPAYWVTAQTLDPLDDVDLFVPEDDTLAKYIPESTVPAPAST